MNNLVQAKGGAQRILFKSIWCAAMVCGLLIATAFPMSAQTSRGIIPELEPEQPPPEMDALLETTTEDAYFDANVCAGIFYVIKDHSDVTPSDRALQVYEALRKVLDQAQREILLAGVEIEEQTRQANFWDVTGRRRAGKFVASRNSAELRIDTRKCFAIARGRVRLIKKY